MKGGVRIEEKWNVNEFNKVLGTVYRSHLKQAEQVVPDC